MTILLENTNDLRDDDDNDDDEDFLPKDDTEYFYNRILRLTNKTHKNGKKKIILLTQSFYNLIYLITASFLF